MSESLIDRQAQEELLQEAIDIGFSADVEYGDKSFEYDPHELYEIKAALGTGATHEELEAQYDCMKEDFGGFMTALHSALEDSDEEHHDTSESIAHTEGRPPAEAPDESSREDVRQTPSRDAGPNDEPTPAPKSSTSERKKKLLIWTGIFGATIVAVLGVAAYFIVQQSGNGSKFNHLPPPKTSSSVSTPPGAASPPASGTGSANTNTPSSSGPKTVASTQRVTLQGSSASTHPSAPTPAAKTNEITPPPSTMEGGDSTSAPNQENGLAHDVELRSIESKVMSHVDNEFDDLRGSVRGQVNDKFESLRGEIASLKQELSKLQNNVSAREDSGLTKYDRQRLKGRTRLGEFSILQSAGVPGRVVALSPTGRVITLEEGESDVYAAGSNLTVKEVIGDGEAVLFSDDWFIDGKRMPATLRETRLEASRDQSDQSQDKEDVPSPLSVAKMTSRNKPSSSGSAAGDYPSFERAPGGWVAMAIIPPGKAIISTPNGDTKTIDLDTTLPGLGVVRSIQQDRIFAGNFYIPLSHK